MVRFQLKTDNSKIEVCYEYQQPMVSAAILWVLDGLRLHKEALKMLPNAPEPITFIYGPCYSILQG